MDIRAMAEEYGDEIIRLRRQIHSRPELSFEEVETTALIHRYLEELGIEVRTFAGHTGLVGRIRGGREGGATVMLRADIDALPVEEKTGAPYAATNGNMHACGHDCHAAMLLGAARILAQTRGEWGGEVHLLFQGGEETTVGARYYADQGVLEGVDALFALHVWGTLDAPLLNFDTGVRMASCDNFRLEVQGVGAHGSAPHLGRDAVVAAASVILNLQTFVSRRNDPQNMAVLTIGTIRGGQAFNIIPGHVEMTGTVRSYSPALRETLAEEMRRIALGTAEAMGCTANLTFHSGLPPLINESDELCRIASEAAVRLYGREALGAHPPLTCSEDFALLAARVPACYGLLGCRNEACGAVYPNHNDRFAVDESILHRGTALYAQFALDYLEGRQKK